MCPYQTLITRHQLDVERCAVWAGMGMGKTLSTLHTLDCLFTAGEDHPVLVLAPKRVAKYTWPREAAKWNQFKHLNIVPITGTEEERKFALKHDAPIFTCNYDNLPWLVQHFNGKWPFRTVVSDESTRLKSFRLRQGGARAAALGVVAHKYVERFIELTGTPSPNGLADLWGQMWFLDSGVRLGRTYDAFRQRWFQRNFDGYGIDALPLAQEQIQDRLRDICVTIDPADWFDLEKPVMNNIYVELPARARKLYRDMEKEMFMSLEQGDVEAFGAAARTQKCLQIANGAAYLGEATDPGERKWAVIHDEKLDALESIVEEANGMPVMCAYEFKSDRTRILRAFPKAVDLATESGFETFLKGKSPLGVAHPASMGHGVDGLQDVTNVLALFGHNWNLEQYQQIIERIGPMRQKQSGHNRAVFVHHIIARDTVDELVMARRETKREVQDILLDAMKRRR